MKKTTADFPNSFDIYDDVFVSNIYRKWVVELIERPAKNTKVVHLYSGSGTGMLPFYDTRKEARRSAKSLRANYGFETRVRPYGTPWYR